MTPNVEATAPGAKHCSEAIPQKLEQGGGHRGKSAHMCLLPDVD